METAGDVPEHLDSIGGPDRDVLTDDAHDGPLLHLGDLDHFRGRSGLHHRLELGAGRQLGIRDLHATDIETKVRVDLDQLG